MTEYVEATVERLKMRWMDITPGEIREGLEITAQANIRGDDAEYLLFTFLERLSPYGEYNYYGRLPNGTVRFMGWPAITLALRTVLDGIPVSLRNEVLARKWGRDAVRMAAAVYTYGRTIA